MLPFHIPKRRRDEEDSDEERYSKKTRRWSFQRPDSQPPFHDPNFPLFHASRSCLPPSPPRQHSPPPITPSFPKHSHSHDIPATHIPSSPTHDIDMSDSDFEILHSPPPDSPIMQILRPAKLNAQLFASSDPSSSTGRIPTPIHGTFYAPRGPIHRSTSQPTTSSSLSSLPPPVLRKQNNVDRARDWRMPSPISEDEAPDTPTAFTQSQLERLSVGSRNHSAESMEMDDMDLGAQSRHYGYGESGERNENMEPPPTPLGKKGRARSGAFTGKGRFSMGYRDDCEKCRARIPGHYSHFLPG